MPKENGREAEVAETVKSDVIHTDPVKVLKLLRNGEAMSELAEHIEKVVAGVRLTGKGGAVALKLEISPLVAGNGVSVEVRDTITSKVPELERESSIFYTTRTNTLQREDPRQMRMDLDGNNG